MPGRTPLLQYLKKNQFGLRNKHSNNGIEAPERQKTEQSAYKEIREVLVRHWRVIDRARLHTFHLWLLLFAITQTAVIIYLRSQV